MTKLAKKEPGPQQAEIVDSVPPTQLARYSEPTQELALTPVFSLETAKQRLKELQEFVKFYLVEGEDFGTIPGTPKPTLFKGGADKLCDIYGIADRYAVTNRIENWDKNLFDFEVECTLVSKRTNALISTGMGSCSSYESKYRYRDEKRKCPKCGNTTIIKGKEEFGGGYICWKKEGKSDGCGAKFKDDDRSITEQTIGRVDNENIPDLKNTLLKMAKKRAKVDAVLSATRSSGLFTQDIEDWPSVEHHEEKKAEPAAAAPPPPPKAAAPPPPKPPAAKPPVPSGTPPAKPPRAEIPNKTPAPAAAAPPPPAPPASTPARSGQQWARDICTNAQVSSTNLTAFVCKHLGVDASTIGQCPRIQITGTLWSLEQTLDKFGPKPTAVFIKDEAAVDASVKSFFQMAYAKSQA